MTLSFSPLSKDIGKNPLFLDKNESPFSLPPSPREELRQILCQTALNRYPDGPSTGLRSRLAAYLDLEPSQIMVGNGGDELLYLLFIALTRSGGRVLTLEPSFSEYRHLSKIFHQEQRALPLTLDGTSISLDEEAFIDAMARLSPSLILLDSPNNPTGLSLSGDFLQRVVELAPCPVVVDEAYVEFASSSLVDRYRGGSWPSNLIVLRTLSKAWGLAGLRLGYLIAQGEILSTLEAVRPPYNVNALSQEAGQIVLGYQEWMESRVFSLRYIRDRFIQQINCLEGWTAYESSANFALVQSPWGQEEMEALFGSEKIRVKFVDFSSSEGTFARITIGTEEEMAQLLFLLQSRERPLSLPKTAQI